MICNLVRSSKHNSKKFQAILWKRFKTFPKLSLRNWLYNSHSSWKSNNYHVNLSGMWILNQIKNSKRLKIYLLCRLRFKKLIRKLIVYDKLVRSDKFLKISWWFLKYSLLNRPVSQKFNFKMNQRIWPPKIWFNRKFISFNLKFLSKVTMSPK